jgi:hypothetical protein
VSGYDSCPHRGDPLNKRALATLLLLAGIATGQTKPAHAPPSKPETPLKCISAFAVTPTLPSFLVGFGTKVYSGMGADIVMESIAPVNLSERNGLAPNRPGCKITSIFQASKEIPI